MRQSVPREVQMKEQSRGLLEAWSRMFSIAFIGAICLVFNLGCEPAPKDQNVFTDSVQSSSSLPDAVARIRVTEAVSIELSRLERMIKPHLQKELNQRPNCVTREISTLAQYFYKWECGTNSNDTPRTEITGTEWTNQPQDSQTWVGQSRLTTKFIESTEDTQTTPGLTVQRRFEMIWARNSTPENGEATIIYRVSQSRLPFRARAGGPRWDLVLRGTIEFVNGSVRLKPNTLVTLNGEVSGRDGDFGTIWANGRYELVAVTPITLDGIAQTSCTRPLGQWELVGTGFGQTVRTDIVTDLTGGRDFNGSSFNWAPDLCTGY